MAEMNGVKTTDVAFLRLADGLLKPLRAVMWDRASWAIHLLDLPVRWSFPLSLKFTILTSVLFEQSSSTPALVASSFLSRTSAAPTSLLPLSPSLVLVGRSNGALLLVSLLDAEPSQQAPNLIQLGELNAAHADGVSDLALLREKEERKRWEVETAGRDGTRCVIEVVRVGAEATMRKMDERAVVGRGSIEKVRHPSHSFFSLSPPSSPLSSPSRLRADYDFPYRSLRARRLATKRRRISLW